MILAVAINVGLFALVQYYLDSSRVEVLIGAGIWITVHTVLELFFRAIRGSDV